jgi:hypothetical protein
LARMKATATLAKELEARRPRRHPNAQIMLRSRPAAAGEAQLKQFMKYD